MGNIFRKRRNETAHGESPVADSKPSASATQMESSHLNRQKDAFSTQKTVENTASAQEAHLKTPDEEDSEKKAQFVTELRNKYKTLCGDMQPAPFLHDTYDIDKLYVESGIKFLEEKHGESNEQQKWTMLKDYKKVFTDPQIKSKRRIIDGEPGYGKSTLALMIMHDWCQGIAPMKDYQILILLRPRQFRNVPTVYSAIKKFLLPKDSTLTEDDIKSILDNSSTVILLDGYDEYPDRGKKDTDINHIIRGDMFQKHEVVLTTRTSCLPPNHANATIKRMRFTGFDDASRETYIRNVVASDSYDVADKISKFFKENSVIADLWKIPLFFAMICYMVKNSERFQNLKNVTQIFGNIIKCFCSHNKMKATEENRENEFDHSKLDKIAFEGLRSDAQQMSWCKNTMRYEIEKNLYDEYVLLGILVEEEVFNYDTLEYSTEARFFHRLFAEWYAAHYLAKVAAMSDAKFEPWLSNTGKRAADSSQFHQAAISKQVHSLENLNPKDVHYMYRCACGLNSDAAQKIIKHLGTNEAYQQYTLLCMTEWCGNLEAIMGTITSICSQIIEFRDRDSLLLQKSTVDLLEFASRQKIPIFRVDMCNCLDSDSSGNLRVKPSYLSLPVMETLSEIAIYEVGGEITEKETRDILQYSAKCLSLEEIEFNLCLLPRYIEVTESMSVLKSREFEVEWSGYTLNLESGQWDKWGRIPMTDEGYQRAVLVVRSLAERRRQGFGRD